MAHSTNTSIESSANATTMGFRFEVPLLPLLYSAIQQRKVCMSSCWTLLIPLSGFCIKETQWEIKILGVLHAKGTPQPCGCRSRGLQININHLENFNVNQNLNTKAICFSPPSKRQPWWPVSNLYPWAYQRVLATGPPQRIKLNWRIKISTFLKLRKWNGQTFQIKFGYVSISSSWSQFLKAAVLNHECVWGPPFRLAKWMEDPTMDNVDPFHNFQYFALAANSPPNTYKLPFFVSGFSAELVCRSKSQR